MEYLGHIISTQGVAPNPTKASAVVQWPVPRNSKDVQTFLGMTGYYACFVRNYADLTAPLSDLLKKDYTWKQTEGEQSEFERLNTALTIAPVLVYPDYTCPFSYSTDASDIAVGAVLQQGHENGRQPLQLFSKKLDTAEQNYTVSNHELLAIVLCTVRQQPYLAGGPT